MYSDWRNGGFGNCVIIESDHPDYNIKFYHIYAHLDSISSSIWDGKELSTDGVYLGESGETGNATGPHLHYEIRMTVNSWKNVRNPEGFLARSDSGGYSSVHGAVKKSGSFISDIKILGADKPTDRGYSWSYTYAPWDATTRIPDEAAYGINYLIARITPGSISLDFDNGSIVRNISVTPNTDMLITQVNLP